MRSVEEIIEWVKGQNFVFVQSDTVLFMRELLKFIESEPPCQHRYKGRLIPDPEFRERVYHYKFCPDCGAELENPPA